MWENRVPSPGRAPHRLSRPSEDAVREAVAAAALGNERALAIARALFYGALLLRFELVSQIGTAGALITTVPLVLGIAFSLLVLRFARRPPTGERLWIGSVALDAAVVFTTLLPNVLWPTPQYVGVLTMPDTAAVLLATTAAGLRLSPRAAVVGSALNGVSLIALVAADRAVSGPRFATGIGHISLYLFWIAGFGVVAAILAHRSRRLASRGAVLASAAERAQQGLWSVLGDHHDLRSLLTSAVIRADTLAQPVEPSSGNGSQDRREDLSRLNRDLRLIRDVVEEVKQRALGTLQDRGSPIAAALVPAVDMALERSQRRFSEVRFAREPTNGEPTVLVGGGEAALQRLLDNVLANAAEGDGQRHAGLVTVRVISKGGGDRVVLEIEDDGPGISIDHDPAATEARSNKPGGTGLGLAIVRGLVEASGGTLRCGSSATGGAVVTVTLPAAVPPEQGGERA